MSECICSNPESWGYTCPVHRIACRAEVPKRDFAPPKYESDAEREARLLDAQPHQNALDDAQQGGTTMMRAATISIHDAIHNRMVLRRGYVSDRWPGLAIHRSLDNADFWNVTHVASGQTPGVRVMVYSMTWAARIADALAARVDWARSPEELRADPRAPAAGRAVQELLNTGNLTSTCAHEWVRMHGDPQEADYDNWCCRLCDAPHPENNAEQQWWTEMDAKIEGDFPNEDSDDDDDLPY